MGIPQNQVSYDLAPDLFSTLEDRSGMGQSKVDFKVLIVDSYEFIYKYLKLLPPLDQTISRLYYKENLSQDQISDLLGISQAAVSRRLKFTIDRIKFLIKMPTLNPLQVRKDFEIIFPESLRETAFYFYWEFAQNRVKYLISTSQSGAANKFRKIVDLLEEEGKLVNSGKDVMDTDSKEEYAGLILIYLDYFRSLQKRPNVISHLYKKNDKKRASALVHLNPIYR